MTYSPKYSKDEIEQMAHKWAMQKPGKRGIDIPEARYDQIFHIASGITQPLWGRPPTPEQMHYLHTNNLTSADQISGLFAKLQHPHAPGMSVGEYGSWKDAMQTYEQHAKPAR